MTNEELIQRIAELERLLALCKEMKLVLAELKTRIKDTQ